MTCYCPKCGILLEPIAACDEKDFSCGECGHRIESGNRAVWILLSSLLSCAILFVVLRLWQSDIRYPLVYHHDALSYDILIKTIIDNGWYLTNRYIGMPYGVTFHDFPTTDIIFLGSIKLLSLMSDNVFVVANLAFLLTFPLVAAVSLLVLMRIGLNGAFALTASLLYTFLPYHLMRQVHLNYCFYFMVPVAIYCALRLFGNSPPFYGNDSNRLRLNWRYLFIAVLIGVTSEYFAFYSCYLLLLAGILAGLYRKRLAPLISSILLVFVITVSFAATLIPVVRYQMVHGKNQTVANRSVNESERYALKISQMLLPVRNHRIPQVAAWTEKYHLSGIPSSSESSFSALGVIGSAGFISMIVVLLDRRKEWDNGTLFGQMSLLNVAAVLYGTVGGFATLFALLVTPALRGHARISIFIAFIAFTAIFMFLQKAMLDHPTLNKRGMYVLIGTMLLVFGVWDQSTSAIVPKYEEIKAACDSDADFVRRIETLLPPDSMVFQLPYHPFPEAGSLHKLPDYELARPYLHSTRLRWSYGAINGREASNWQKSVVAKTIEEFVAEIRKAGFKGVYIDRRGFADSGSETEGKLTAILNQKPLVSRNGDNSFFVLR